MEWNIVADTSCDLNALPIPDENVSFESVPFVLQAGAHEFVDEECLDIANMVATLEATKEPGHTACPSPETWFEKFSKPGKVIAITISANLSGSLNSAMLARQMILDKHPERQIEVIDSKSAGSELTMMVRKAQELIKSGLPFDTVVQQVRNFAERTHTVFALSSFDNLVKNGRVGKLAGFVAGKLGLWGIGIASPQGAISIKSKVRGTQKALAAIVADMKERAFAGGPVLITHCLNLEAAERLKALILEAFHNAQVDIMPTRGLCSFYAEKGGMIIAF